MAIFDFFSRKKSCRLLTNAEGEIAEKYNHFREFLTHNRDALGIMADLEQTYYGGGALNPAFVRKKYGALVESTRGLIASLNGISRGKYSELEQICDGIEKETVPLLKPEGHSLSGHLVLPFELLSPEMVKLAGSKATNLATVRNILGIEIPRGFVITAIAFERFLSETGLSAAIEEMLGDISEDMTDEMEAKARAVREAILSATVPSSIANAIMEAYRDLESKTHGNVRIAMRSSAVGEDTAASFAGQYITELNVTRENILDAYKCVLASKYSPGAILYRLRYGLDDDDTPMCVAGIAMVDAKSSGVVYTRDPSQPGSSMLKVSSIFGLGEHLVSGAASPDVFHIDRLSGQISGREIGRKETRLVGCDKGGAILEEVPEQERSLPSVDDETIQGLARWAIKLEEYFKCPQDVEWALDKRGKLFFLQSRPLGLSETGIAEKHRKVSQQHTVLLTGGKPASMGAATGVVFHAGAGTLGQIPENAILVARTASPEYAGLVGKIRGIITDVGSVASHLASVAREFGIPAIFDTGDATSRLKEGATITMSADTASVYEGLVPELASEAKPIVSHVFESPVHRRMRAVLDRISPLNLTEPKDASFSPRGCMTIHDIIRFSHETAMKEMFGLSREAEVEDASVKLTCDLPLFLYIIDLGEGLREGLTSCDSVTPDYIESVPLKALWSGLAHPGITWSGGVGVGFSGFMSLMATGTTTDLEDMSKWVSYALISKEYMNVSARFGYHFASIDAFCGDEPNQNYASLQFSGGAGGYYGRSLRISFLAKVLERLGFNVAVSGDLLEATLSGHDKKSMTNALDQVGRLLASSRLLDMAISNQEQVGRMTLEFFRGDYDFLNSAEGQGIPDFYTHTGHWSRVVEAGRTLLCQDGSKAGMSLSAGVASMMGKIVGARYQEFLDNIEAYYYFPVAIAKESSVADAIIETSVRPVSGSIDRAGGLVFGLRNVGNYFVLRVNALEDNFILFEFINNRRFQRAAVDTKIETSSFVNPFHNLEYQGATARKEVETARWYRIKVEISGHALKGYLDDKLLIEYTSEKPIEGYAGLWTKADSVTHFGEITVQTTAWKKAFRA